MFLNFECYAFESRLRMPSEVFNQFNKKKIADSPHCLKLEPKDEASCLILELDRHWKNNKIVWGCKFKKKSPAEREYIVVSEI